MLALNGYAGVTDSGLQSFHSVVEYTSIWWRILDKEWTEMLKTAPSFRARIVFLFCVMMTRYSTRKSIVFFWDSPKDV